ncbi:acyl-CoA dehydrogenase family protein [Bacillus sp. FJAT-47783]|uniref:acyl-CoA dehydrogenase family protein n=1 Tax=Bacillus sp. FJAT-47783 TaxID=2922712 RepID=UPI001FAE6F4C|nr:acyl-CoA dehydrogenase family protein [Bacillus sp. FJAT-47783]
MKYKNKSYISLAYDLVRDIISKEACYIDKYGVFPNKSMDCLRESGLLGILIPEEFGGLGGDILEFTKITEIISRGCSSTGTLYMFHNQVVQRILDFGTDNQKHILLPKMAKGLILGASSWSELLAGADKKNLKTTARLYNDQIILNGNKAYCTGAGEADIYTILVRSNEDKPNEQSFVIVEKDRNGITFGESWDGMGLRGTSTKEIFCKECIVPFKNLLGGLGKGKEIMKRNRQTAIHPGIVGLGICKSALDVARKLLIKKPNIWEYQNTRFVISNLVILTNSVEALIYRAADLANKNSPEAEFVVLEAKVISAEVAEKVTNEVLQLSGAKGYSQFSKISRLYRDAKAIGLMGPTTELCKEFIAGRWNIKGGDLLC